MQRFSLFAGQTESDALSFCEEKNRPIRSHGEAVNTYAELVHARYNGGGDLTDTQRATLVANIKAKRDKIEARRNALDSHVHEHGCGSWRIDADGSDR